MTKKAAVHIIGAGVAGLAAATKLAEMGHSVHLYEAAPQAGGRCRSYADEKLGRRIDNGNHLLLSGNSAVYDYLNRIGASEELVGPERASFPFVDCQSGQSWTVKPGRGPIPFWLFCSHMRVPDTRFKDYLSGFRLRSAKPDDTFKALMDDGGALYRRFWEPLCLGVLNTDPVEAQARLLWPVLAETFLKGEAACRPRVARVGLSETFVDPAVAYLRQKGGCLSLGQRLRGFKFSDDTKKVSGLVFADQTITLGPDDYVISGLPPQVLSGLIPDMVVPDAFRPIVNAHFVIPKLVGKAPWLVGLINAHSHWVFVRGDLASVTVSAASDLAAQDADTIADLLWPEVCQALGIGKVAMGPWRVVKEKRATFAQTPDQVLKRKGPDSSFQNMLLSGDWTAKGLPATIEGSIRSGFAAVANIASAQLSSQWFS